jgi:recombination DNA repair RAD52 pathway protein
MMSVPSLVLLTHAYSAQAIGFGSATAFRNKGEAFQKAKEKVAINGLQGAIQLFGITS